VKRKFRLSKSTDFQRVRRLGKSYAHPLIVLIVLTNQEEQTRFGVTAGRSVGNAVRRNRAKRLIRAALNPHLDSIASGWDVVLIARRPIVEAGYQQVAQAISELLKRAGLIYVGFNSK
jgi:ribonuclease P protein component